MTRLTIEISDSPTSIQKKIDEAIRKKLSRNLDTQKILSIVKNRVQKEITESSTWSSLLGQGPGTLNADFGLRRGSEASRLNEILQALLSSITLSKSATTGRGEVQRITVQGILADFSDVRQLSSARVINKGESLPWFEWLVLRGDEQVVQGYRIEYGRFVRSRSGRAIMILSPSDSFSVDPSFSGTIQDNFITRAIASAIDTPVFDRLMIQEVRRALNGR